MDGLDNPERLRRANRHERAQAGLYGPISDRFVTLTGNVMPGAAQEFGITAADIGHRLKVMSIVEARSFNVARVKRVTSP